MFEDPAQKPKLTRPRYVVASGARVPSVTDVLGTLGKPELVSWANNLGLQGLSAEAVRNERAAEGSALHECIRAYLCRDQADLEPFSPKVRAAGRVGFVRWRQKWLERHDVRPVLIESPLVSNQYGFGGTLDLLAEVDGRLEVLDWKTTKQVYQEHVLQASAYQLLAWENGYEPQAVRVVHVSVEQDGAIGECVETNTRPFAGAFLAALRLHRLMGGLPEIASHTPQRSEQAVMSRFDDPVEVSA